MPQLEAETRPGEVITVRICPQELNRSGTGNGREGRKLSVVTSGGSSEDDLGSHESLQLSIVFVVALVASHESRWRFRRGLANAFLHDRRSAKEIEGCVHVLCLKRVSRDREGLGFMWHVDLEPLGRKR
ncbi:uncharacterized protein DS421_13g425840 [Arachis hypogaea]|nr:uncharacterized protein DS421_13g425840 [Arachis hypogaea]